MSETNVPAAEAEREVNPYELAFHVLPTVAEGEVASVVDTIKSHITTAGGEITGEEVPARFELAYEIIKHLEGRNRKFTSAYFGWIRFTAEPARVEELMAEVEAMKEILRAMVIRLTKVEEENPFYFHEAIDAPKEETVVVEEEETVVVEDEALVEAEEASEETAKEEAESNTEEEKTETESTEAVDGEEKEETV